MEIGDVCMYMPVLSYEIRVDDSELQRKKIAIMNAPRNIAVRAIRDGSPLYLNILRNNTPVRTGGLRASENYELLDPLHGRVYMDSGYGLFADQPTRPHVIEARRARFLRFMIGSTVFFRKRVFHPGTKGAFFIEKTIADAYLPFSDLLDRITEQEIGGI